MIDTPEHILQKQFEIFMENPFREWLFSIFELTDLSRKIIQNRIKKENPDISEADLKAELFKTFYRYDFENESLEKITERMMRFWDRKK